MSRRSLVALVVSCALVAGLGCSLAGVASGATPNPTADCSAHGRLTQQYTAAELRQALATLPADVREYTPCFDELTAALLAAVHGGKGGGGGSGSGLLSTPVIVIVVVLVLAAATLAAIAVRRRRDAPPAA